MVNISSFGKLFSRQRNNLYSNARNLTRKSENITIFPETLRPTPEYMKMLEKQQAKQGISVIKVLKRMYQLHKTIKTNIKPFGISTIDMIKSIKHFTPIVPTECFLGKIKSCELLATVPVALRHSKKQINASLEKICLDNNNIVYLLKNKKKQLGFINISREFNDIIIDYMTNILGRKKYKNIENILVQSMVEDMLRNGGFSNIKATALDIGVNMGRRYNNSSLYERMGMKYSEGMMTISKEKVLEILEKRINKTGKILQ